MVLHPKDHGLKLLNTHEEKLHLLEQTGLQNLIVYPFTEEFSRLRATEYVRDFLVGKIGIKHMIVGYDHHFGRNREGDFKQLQEFSDMYQFGLEEIPAQEVNDCQVSSTKIRNALFEGNVSLASQFLGYNYQIAGRVEAGQQLGREFGFPTANVKVSDAAKVIPAHGVYAVKVEINERQLNGMMNIGVKPTVTSSKDATLEVHIFNWQEEIYGENLTVEFVQRIRDEIKFESKDDLINRLHKDRSEAESMLS